MFRCLSFSSPVPPPEDANAFGSTVLMVRLGRPTAAMDVSCLFFFLLALLAPCILPIFCVLCVATHIFQRATPSAAIVTVAAGGHFLKRTLGAFL